jgi:N-acetyl-anhydromuramyl-L-alanine amidase AmpD
MVSAIIIHADASASARAAAEWCCKSKAALRELWERTPPAKRPKSPWEPVSYHDDVERDGTVFSLVPTERRAWHAGASEFGGVPGCNDYAIGLCLSNRNDGEEPYTALQYQVGAVLCAGYMRRYPAITLDRITTHAIVSPGRKTDPGPRFDLAAFRKRVALEVACAG